MLKYFSLYQDQICLCPKVFVITTLFLQFFIITCSVLTFSFSTSKLQTNRWHRLWRQHPRILFFSGLTPATQGSLTMFPSTNLISTISSSTLDLFLLWSFSFYLSSSPHHSNNGLSSACSSPAQVNRISSNRVSSSQRSSLSLSSNCFFLQTQD